MNTTFVLMGNGIDDYAKNDAALACAAAVGLKGIVDDDRVAWYRPVVSQTYEYI